jgi:hypothetical protein
MNTKALVRVGICIFYIEVTKRKIILFLNIKINFMLFCNGCIPLFRQLEVGPRYLFGVNGRKLNTL